MKKCKIFYLALLLMSVVSCSKDGLVETVIFDKSELHMFLDGSVELIRAKVLPVDAIDKRLVWISSDSTVAMANEGMVSAYSVGECEIKAISASGAEAVCKVIVSESPAEISSIITEYDNYSTFLGGEIKINLEVFPLNFEDDDLTIDIKDPKILERKTTRGGLQTFEFVALAVGSTEIVFTSVANPDVKATCTVDIKEGMVMVDEKDGKEYKIGQIGNRIWMLENYAFLGNSEHEILVPLDKENYNSSTIPYCYVYEYEGSDITEAKELENYKMYGAFYNYPAAESLAPEGWRLPTMADWEDLQKAIGMTDEQIAMYGGYPDRGTVSGKLKEEGTWTTDWSGNPISDDANNQSGWSAKAAGLPFDDVHGEKVDFVWFAKNTAAYWWSSKESVSGSHEIYGLISGMTFIFRPQIGNTDNLPLSVRYVKDVE